MLTAKPYTARTQRMKRRVIINVTKPGKVPDAAVIRGNGFNPCIAHQSAAADLYPVLARLLTVKGDSRIQTDVHRAEPGIIPCPCYQSGSRRIGHVCIRRFQRLPLFRGSVCQHELNVLVLVVKTAAHFGVPQMPIDTEVQKRSGRDL